jgi:hypothetical protein
VKDILDWAGSAVAGVAIERLDFTKKRAALRETGPRYARMLSSFSYARFGETMTAGAAGRGIDLAQVNPAFTSVIGVEKFSAGYALTRHHAAAFAIARRAQGFGERLARKGTKPAGAATPAGSDAPRHPPTAPSPCPRGRGASMCGRTGDASRICRRGSGASGPSRPMTAAP